MDSGKLDLCSGHVQSNEPPFQCMRREIFEELAIPFEESENIYSLGNMKIDYTALENEEYQNNLRCFINVYALKIKDISKISIDNDETVGIGWLSLEDVVNFIRHHMTRLPYEGSIIEQFEEIFGKLENYMFPDKEPKKREE